MCGRRHEVTHRGTPHELRVPVCQKNAPIHAQDKYAAEVVPCLRQYDEDAE
jgi:hypothetical protein